MPVRARKAPSTYIYKAKVLSVPPKYAIIFRCTLKVFLSQLYPQSMGTVSVIFLKFINMCRVRVGHGHVSDTTTRLQNEVFMLRSFIVFSSILIDSFTSGKSRGSRNVIMKGQSPILVPLLCSLFQIGPSIIFNSILVPQLPKLVKVGPSNVFHPFFR